MDLLLDGKTNIDDVYFVDGLKHNLLSDGQLVDKGYQLQLLRIPTLSKIEIVSLLE